MDIYAQVANRIIDQLEQCIIPWQKPWIASGQAISRVTGKPYSLLNQMILGRVGEYQTFCFVQTGDSRDSHSDVHPVCTRYKDVCVGSAQANLTFSYAEELLKRYKVEYCYVSSIVILCDIHKSDWFEPDTQ